MENNESLNLMQELLSGTQMEILSESKILNSSDKKVRTPIEVLNILLGGGLPMAGVVHNFGNSKSGKSTFLYQTLGYCQKLYPDSINIILDMESSADPTRLEVLGIDANRVLRLPATSIESGFLSVIKLLNETAKSKDDNLRTCPIFIIWDSISRGLAQDDSTNSRLNAMDRARVIKNYLPELQKSLEKNSRPFVLGLINQIVNRVDRYGNNHEEFGGGAALGHDVTFNLHFNLKSVDSEGSFNLGKWILIDIDKSKISPTIKSIPVYIDDTKGGVIKEEVSVLYYISEVLQFIVNGGGWYTMDAMKDKLSELEYESLANLLDPYLKKYRWKDLVSLVESDRLFYNLCRAFIAILLSSTYTLQSKIIKPYLDKILVEISDSGAGEYKNNNEIEKEVE